MSEDRAAARRAFEDAIATFEAALSKIEAALGAEPEGEEAAHLAALRDLEDASPLMKRQNAFNAAIVAEIRHQRPDAVDNGLLFCGDRKIHVIILSKLIR